MNPTSLGHITAIPNTARKFGSNLAYAHARVRMPNGSDVDWLLTEDEMDIAYNRALTNPEDVPPAAEPPPKPPLWKRFFRAIGLNAP